MTDHKKDEGQTAVFVIGATIVILLFALTTTAVTSVMLQQRKLLSLADSASQHAATAFTIVDTEEFSLTITPESARRQVEEHLSALEAARHHQNLQIASVHVTGDTTVTVQLSSTAHPPIINFVVPSGIPVIAESTARTYLAE